MMHTPTPWKHVWKHDTHKVKRDKQGRILGPVTMDFEDYHHAVECVNVHDALVEALRSALEHIKYLNEDYDLSETYRNGMKTLAQAEKG